MSCAQDSGCLCGCCAGTSVQTPAPEYNRPGLGSVAYRVGTWAAFKESMLARLSSADYPALGLLKTRANDDFTIAFLDATAVMLDVLTFYQERLANESYLRTAGEVRSLTELARLIAYQPSPGVSASTYLAFLLKAAPGQPPNAANPAITIPKGTQVQSVPSQGKTPQTFETSNDILAKADWNALAVQTGAPWVPRTGDTSVYLQGTATQLQPGDAILIVGDERLQSAYSENWDVRIVRAVQADGVRNRTLVQWSEGLGKSSAGVLPAQLHPGFYVFRQRAALFGYNAVSPLLLARKTSNVLSAVGLLDGAGNDWNFAAPTEGGSALLAVDLDAIYPKVVHDGWLALIRPDQSTTRSPSGFVSLFHVQAVAAVARSAYGQSAKITRAALDPGQTGLDAYYDATRASSALVQSEALAAAEQPLAFPLYGTLLDLRDLRPDLLGVQAVALSGKRQKLSVNPRAGAPALVFQPDDQSGSLTLNPGDLLTVVDPAPLPLGQDGAIAAWNSAAQPFSWRVADASGRTGTLAAAPSDFTLAPAGNSDPVVQEFALVSGVAVCIQDFPHTRIQLSAPLANCYDRATTTVNVNLAPATHGQTVSDILGSGNASTPNQRFKLKQSPLTFVAAATPSGRQSTLGVQVDAVTWSEVPSLYQQGPAAPVYATLNQTDVPSTEVLFGDGTEGGLLPSGQNNIHATYRIGTGTAGNVGVGALTTLLDRPLGVSGVTNPQAATGGQDAQPLADIRANAPQTVLTLGRAVSITDYESYARTFAGIAKAHAIWIPSGPGQGVFITLAGVSGAAVPADSATLANLLASLQAYGNPHVPIRLVSFVETLFTLSAALQYEPKRDPAAVQAQVRQTLYTTLSFNARAFGQGVTMDEVAAVIQGVPGVVAVNVTSLTRGASSTAGDLGSLAGSVTVKEWNAWMAAQIPPLPRLFPDSPTRLGAYLPVGGPLAAPFPAEILVLNPDPGHLQLGLMS